MSSNPGRIMCNWKTPIGHFARCFLWNAYQENDNIREVVKEFLYKVPSFYEEFAIYQRNELRAKILAREYPTIGSIKNRLDKSIRYPNEDPRNNKEMGKYFEVAKTAFKKRTIISKKELRSLLTQASIVTVRGFDEELYLGISFNKQDFVKIGIGDAYQRAKAHSDEARGPFKMHYIFNGFHNDLFAIEKIIKREPPNIGSEWKCVKMDIILNRVIDLFKEHNVLYEEAKARVNQINVAIMATYGRADNL
jgi:hypothetical protein